MKPAARSLGRGTLLLALAGVIVKLLITGQMSRYIAPILDPLSAVTAAVLAVMGSIELVPRRAAAPGSVDAADPSTGAEEALTALLVALVVGVGFLVTPRALGSSGLGGERLGGLLLRYASGGATRGPATQPGDQMVLGDFDALLTALRQTGEGGQGRRVRVTGTVVAGEDLAPDELVVLRYQVAHCVADARPLAILIVTPRGVDPRPFGPDQWIEVQGTLAVRERAGDRLVTIEATGIGHVEEPANPYLSATRPAWEPR